LEFRALLPKFGQPLPSGESLRAMAIAYTIDYRRVRRRLWAVGELQRAFDELAGDSAGRVLAEVGSPWSPRAWWCRLRYGRRIGRVLRWSMFDAYDARQRQRCRSLVCRRRGPLLEAVRKVSGRRTSPDPAQDARDVLAAVARDPATWSRQLVVLRSVQTLSVLDLKTYCELVAELGEYDVKTEQTEAREAFRE